MNTPAIRIVSLVALACGVGFGPARSGADEPFPPPVGIYILSKGRDFPRSRVDDRLVNLRDYDFVAGYTLRVWWRDIEPTEGAYDFGVIDEAFRRVAPLGQRINLEVLDDVPDYVIEGVGSTYTDHRGKPRIVPWNALAKRRRAALQVALAEHVVDDGRGLRLSDHPLLAAVNADATGLNFGVRDLNGGLRAHPDYTRKRFVDAVMQGVAAGRAPFPRHEGYLFFFAMNDDTPGPPIDRELIDRLDALYNGPGQPALSFFIENLSDIGPVPQRNGYGTGANLLAWTRRRGRTMMQALDIWAAHPPKRAAVLTSGNPATGIRLAYDTFGTRFFELYVRDLDDAVKGAVDAEGRPIVDDLRAWNALLTSPEPLPGDYNDDGAVNAADYSVWRDAVGEQVADPYDGADGDGSGVVDERDHAVWKLSVGRSARPQP